MGHFAVENRKRSWSVEDDRRLLELRAAGRSTLSIAVALKRRASSQIFHVGRRCKSRSFAARWRIRAIGLSPCKEFRAALPFFSKALLSMFDPSADLPDETPVDSVRFPTRISNALSHPGILTLGEIRESSDETLRSLPDLGTSSVKWLRDKV
ncbi:hypothetical protein JQ609_33295 [Bradyrhizobium sp. AUGA SZCCT0169]|uniref:DNA-directed RNA polymerase subunit alpha C-terminal domain-containing protein n=1 Tax=Bradyrhizobium sp. AUGA SZCCT0169 TaxID=2807663 RepID=UPI001BAE4449|nr:hypothetical protein [Bradyrhizobium sp. AUGA SZCCT0169]